MPTTFGGWDIRGFFLNSNKNDLLSGGVFMAVEY